MEPWQSSKDRMKHSMGLRQPVRVLLIDASIFVLHVLSTFLSKRSGIVVVGTASTEAEAFSAVETCRPDVVVLDVVLGRASGIDMCRVIRESCPNIAVLFFSTYDDKNILRSAILAGAQGFLLKNAPGESVAKSIEIVSAGQAIIDRQLTQQVITWVRAGGRAALRTTMGACSSEDRRILSLVAAGKTHKEIAQELNVALRVVTTRVQRIYERLRLSRRSEAARYFAQGEKGSTH